MIVIGLSSNSVSFFVNCKGHYSNLLVFLYDLRPCQFYKKNAQETVNQKIRQSLITIWYPFNRLRHQSDKIQILQKCWRSNVKYSSRWIAVSASKFIHEQDRLCNLIRSAWNFVIIDLIWSQKLISFWLYIWKTTSREPYCEPHLICSLTRHSD